MQRDSANKAHKSPLPSPGFLDEIIRDKRPALSTTTGYGNAVFVAEKIGKKRKQTKFFRETRSRFMARRESGISLSCYNLQSVTVATVSKVDLERALPAKITFPFLLVLRGTSLFTFLFLFFFFFLYWSRGS